MHSCSAGHGGQQGEGLAAPAAARVTSLRRAGCHRLADALAVGERTGLGLRQAVVDAAVLARGLFENAVRRAHVLEAAGPQCSEAAPASSSPQSFEAIVTPTLTPVVILAAPLLSSAAYFPPLRVQRCCGVHRRQVVVGQLGDVVCAGAGVVPHGGSHSVVGIVLSHLQEVGEFAGTGGHAADAARRGGRPSRRRVVGVARRVAADEKL